MRAIILAVGSAAALLLAAVALAQGADAPSKDVYRWVDENGVVHYSDKPPAPGAQPAQLPQLQTYKAGSTPPLPQSVPNAPPAVSLPAPAPGEVTITAPGPQETIRDAEGHISVAVNAQVPPGGGLVYYLDSAAQNDTPTPSTAFMLNGVQRGEHQIAVALVGPGGNEIARSAAVTVFMMPPRAGMGGK